MTAPSPRRGPLIFDEDEAPAARRDAPHRAAPKDAETARRGPLEMEDDAAAEADPSAAPHPEETPAEAAAMTRVMALPRRRRSWIAPLFWSAFTGLLGLGISVWLWEFAARMTAANPVLGTLVWGLCAALAIAAAAACLRELAGLARLRRAETARIRAARALTEGDRAGAIAALAALRGLWAGRPELAPALDTLAAREADLPDARALIEEAERLCVMPLDEAARRAAVDGARSVAAATAFSPAPFLDVIAAFWLNLRMIRRIAEIYGGGAGAIGGWRLLRAVASHLAATGAVALGDDLLGPALGGGAVQRISRRFGEGIVNGALTARVGVAAMEVCRPLPYGAGAPPRVRGVVAAALGDWKAPR